MNYFRQEWCLVYRGRNVDIHTLYLYCGFEKFYLYTVYIHAMIILYTNQSFVVYNYIVYINLLQLFTCHGYGQCLNQTFYKPKWFIIIVPWVTGANWSSCPDWSLLMLLQAMWTIILCAYLRFAWHFIFSIVEDALCIMLACPQASLVTGAVIEVRILYCENLKFNGLFIFNSNHGMTITSLGNGIRFPCVPIGMLLMERGFVELGTT